MANSATAIKVIRNARQTSPILHSLSPKVKENAKNFFDHIKFSANKLNRS